MNLLSHVSFAFLCGILLLNLINPSNIFIFLLLVSIFGFVPDIDSANSFIGKKFKLLSFLPPHRGFVHSILFMIFLSIIIFYFTKSYDYFFAVIIGFSSHLLLDSLTPSGTKPFWPSELRFRWKIRTNSLVDYLITIFFIVLDYVLVGLLI